MWSPFKVYRDLAEAKGELAYRVRVITELQQRVDELEEERKKMIDWLLSINGAPSTLYGEPEPTPKNQPPSNPFNNVSRAGDWSRVAERLEAEASGYPSR